ncbi:hypothetical protein BDD43_5944 [Mucilaginibacter gracilis]|uniref:Nucleotide-diphospho-sugar transferase n=1 Tax=Mucilaginibacter gracilis TaxID=423350 RepID=A0A495JA32_9SPHI|nr:nucleotide-diphospho-sugar transferase [Mucilaginibacter gracilis]RKR85673.1 hypothetical protein BDD43_5944 [Mucilaginibacter gracilis]
MSLQAQQVYKTKSAILFIIFNRHDTSLQVLQQIKLAQPARVYITADGPRTNRSGEDIRCAEAREAVLAAIDWDCQVKTLFRNENIGPKEAIATAIDWFFEHEEEGIILEHDCLPANSFFMFCDTLLEKYRLDTRIWLISGCNLQEGKKWGNASYYFSNLTNGWGWATWKRSWKDYDKNLTRYNAEEVRPQLAKIFDDELVIDTWQQIFNDCKAGKIDTWDYQATFTHLFSHAINIIANTNLVSNIGFGEGAENTTNASHSFASVTLTEITEVTHPKYILPEKEADMHTLTIEFNLAGKRSQLKKYNAPKRRFKRWARGLFK